MVFVCGPTVLENATLQQCPPCQSYLPEFSMWYMQGQETRLRCLSTVGCRVTSSKQHNMLGLHNATNLNHGFWKTRQSMSATHTSMAWSRSTKSTRALSAFRLRTLSLLPPMSCWSIGEQLIFIYEWKTTLNPSFVVTAEGQECSQWSPFKGGGDVCILNSQGLSFRWTVVVKTWRWSSHCACWKTTS